MIITKDKYEKSQKLSSESKTVALHFKSGIFPIKSDLSNGQCRQRFEAHWPSRLHHI